MHIISGVYWDKGMRNNNQDSLMLEQVYTKRGRIVLAAVSDGIGGLCEGETASGFIIERLLFQFYQEILTLIQKQKGKRALEKSLLRCFYELNQVMNRYGKSKEIQLGATVTILLIYGRNYIVMHLGDSRGYLLGKNRSLIQITTDHTDAFGRLTSCLGSFAYRCPDIKTGKIKRKTGFLLCTDGFYHYLKKAMLQEILEPGEIVTEEQIEKRLKQLALSGMRQGEKDNVSAVYLICR